MCSTNTVLMIIVIILLLASCRCYDYFDSAPLSQEQLQKEVVGEVRDTKTTTSAPYMDNYKWGLIGYDNQPLTLFQAMNIFHPDDVLFIQCSGNDCLKERNPSYGSNVVKGDGTCKTNDISNKDKKFIPVARIISVMLVDGAFPIVILDRAVNLAGYKLGVAATNKSKKLHQTILFDDPLKTPITEIMSVSRRQIY